MSGAGNLGILYLEKNKASFYYGRANLSLQADITGDILRDMEVVSEERLTLFLRSLVAQPKPLCTVVVVILSPEFTFDKEFPNDPLEKFTHDLNIYQDSIPFENISRKTLKTNKGWRASFTNKDLCESLKTSFEKLRILVVGIVPFSLLSLTVSEFSKGMSYKLIIEKMNIVKEYSFLREGQKELVSNKNNSTKNSMIGLVLAVFLFSTAILLLIQNGLLTKP